MPLILSKEELSELADRGEHAARLAADHIRLWVGEHREVREKTGSGSLASQVVTEVDLACQDLILSELRATLSPQGIGLLTEEEDDDASRLHRDYFWCIDPLDGTLPFIEGVAGYSVSIALVSREGVSQLGIVIDPRTGNTLRAIRGGGLTMNGQPFAPITRNNTNSLHWMMNRSMKTHPRYNEIEERMNRLALHFGYPKVEMFSISGGVLHACRVLQEGPAVYFTLPKTGTGGGSIWDYAATACFFEEAGLPVTTARGNPLHLNHSETTFMSHCGVLYASSPELKKGIEELCSHFLP